jgi:two-component system sensor histidine kinase VicK
LNLKAELERTEVWTAATKDIDEKSPSILSKIKSTYDIFIDPSGLKSLLGAEPTKKSHYLDLKATGIKIRIITEITRDNLAEVSELTSIGEVRHLEGIIGNFVIADRTNYAGFAKIKNHVLVSELITSNVGSFVKQQQYFFETLWEKAIPLEQRIKEIEEGREPEKTEIIQGVANVVALAETISQIKERLDTCVDSSGVLSVATNLYGKLELLKEKGVKLRYITEVTRENIQVCKKLVNVVELRHLQGIKGNFGIADGVDYRATASVKAGEHPSEVIRSTAKHFVEQQQYFFDTLWGKASPAGKRIKEIEEGREPEIIELIPDTQESITRALEIMDKTKDELVVLFATPRTFIIAMTVRPIEIYRRISEQGAKVRILVPKGEGIENSVSKLELVAPLVDIRVSEADLNTRLTILVSDRKKFMSWELKDDTLDDPYKAGGIATYSSIESLADSYATIFDNLWMITEFAEDLRIANIKLESNERAMKEFINIAAHELRTPIQPILGLSEMLQEFGSSQDQRKFLEVIVRNAHRLEQLAEGILDVTRIESGKLQLSKEQVDLNELVGGVVDDMQRSFAGRYATSSDDDVNASGSGGGDGGVDGKQRIKVTCQQIEIDGKKKEGMKDERIGSGNSQNKMENKDGHLLVVADPSRLTQVISNLLSNAVKFTEIGSSIYVYIKRVTENGNAYAVVSVSDEGPGIDPEIFPRLFEKFASKSKKGVGLGLYLSKNIVEAHGGKIWSENNKDGKRGATFTFTLPLAAEST